MRSILLGTLVVLAASVPSAPANAQQPPGILTFDSPSADLFINLSLQTRLQASGNCTALGEQIRVQAGNQGPMNVTCNRSSSGFLQWSVSNLSVVDQPDGNLPITVWRVDQPANRIVRQFNKDTVVPLLRVTSPSSGDFINRANVASFLVQGMCSEVGQPVEIVFRRAVDNGVTPRITTRTTCTNTRTFASRSNLTSLGDNTDIALIVTHADRAGNEAVASSSYFMDVQDPRVAFTGLPPAINLSNAATLAFQGTCNKEGGFVFLDVIVEGKNYEQNLTTNCNGGRWSFSNASIAGPLVPDGQVVLKLNLTSAVTGASGTATASLLKDTVPPTLRLTGPGRGYRMTRSTGTAFRAEGTCSENGRQIRISGSAQATAACVNGRFDTNLDFASRPDGDQTLRFVITDAANNSATQSFSFNKDTLPAQLSVNPLQTITSLNATNIILSGSCSEHGSFAQPVVVSGAISATAICHAPSVQGQQGAWSLTTSLATLPDGQLTLHFDHSDAAGNAAQRITRLVNKDTVPPVVRVERPVAPSSPKFMINLSNVSAVEFGGTCTKEGAVDVRHVGGSLNGRAVCASGQWSYRTDLSAVADGDIQLRFTITDSVGQSASQDLIVFKDTLAPTLTLDPSSIRINIASVANVLLQGRCSEHGAFAQPVLIEIPGQDEARAVCQNGSWSLSVAKTAFAEGASVVTARHTDLAGNSTRAQASVVKKSTAPALQLQAPPQGFLLNLSSTRFRLQGTCSENGRQVEFTGAVARNVDCASGAFGFEHDFASSADGDLLVRATHTDEFGNASTQDLVMKKDTIAPTLAITSPAASAQLVVGANLFQGTCSDGAGDIQIEGLTSSILAATCNDGRWQISVNSSQLLTAPTLTMTVRWQDLAKNGVAVNRAFTRPPLDTGTLLTSFSEEQGQLDVNFMEACTIVGGKPYCWGRSSLTYFDVPNPTPIDLTRASQVTVGDRFACAIVSGSLRCWGQSIGPLGLLTRSPFLNPMATLSSQVTQADAGSSHLCVVAAGRAICLGTNTQGQLGNGTTGSSSVPVVAIESGVTQISSGEAHTCAIVAGSLRCWGANESGQLGDGSRTSRSSPVTIIPSGVSHVSAGFAHTCAVVNGALMCWGSNSSGQLGDGTYTARLVPTTIISSGAFRAAAGRYNSCAIVSGAAQCWGFNSRGGVGDGTRIERTTPVTVIPSGVSHIAVGMVDTACAIANGTPQCWGLNLWALLGNGDHSFMRLPRVMDGFETGVTAFSGTGDRACTVQDGALKCVGTPFQNRPFVSPLAFNADSRTLIGNGVEDVSILNEEGCAVVNGSLRCWASSEGRFPASFGVTSVSPKTVFSSGVSMVALKARAGCVIVNGSVQCWGFGDVDRNDRNYGLREFVKSGATFVTISTRGTNACAIVSGALQCWGTNESGQIGDGTRVRRNDPVTVISSGVSHASVNDGHACAVVNQGLLCWGVDNFNSLGIPGGGSTLVPRAVPSLSSRVTFVTTDMNSTCVVVSGEMRCSGFSPYFFGDGQTSQTLFTSLMPDERLRSGIRQIWVVSNGTYCVDKSGSLLCWGNNEGGGINPRHYVRTLSPSNAPEMQARVFQPGQLELASGRSIEVQGHRLSLGFDGNLMLSSPANQVVWASGTARSCQSGCRAIFGGDGALVLLDSRNVEFWRSHSGGSGHRLVIGAGAAPVRIENATAQRVWPSTEPTTEAQIRAPASTNP